MYNDHIRPSIAAGGQSIFALSELITATRALTDDLRQVSVELHQDLELSVPARAVLFDLRQHGAHTVPELARQRGVSRQSIQTTVNPLLSRGLVILQDNPAHRRSRLVALTPAGKEMIREVMRREGVVLKELADGLTAGDIRQAAGVVATVQQRVAAATG